MKRQEALGIILGGSALAAAALLQPGEPIAPERVRAVCEQYAGLDLSGLAPLCIDAGYVGELFYLQPAAEEPDPYWPTVFRPIQPEDLDR